jgi:predicted acylesterase/phospholipase RssA
MLVGLGCRRDTETNSRMTGRPYAPNCKRDASGHWYRDPASGLVLRLGVGKMIFDSSTIVAIALDSSGTVPWLDLKQYIKDLDITFDAADHIEYPLEAALTHLREGKRVILFVDVFENWPYRKESPSRTPAEYMKAVSELRVLARGTDAEILVVLYQDPRAITEAPHDLAEADMGQLRKFYLVPCAYNDRKHDKVPTPAQRKELKRAIESTLNKALKFFKRTANYPKLDLPRASEPGTEQLAAPVASASNSVIQPAIQLLLALSGGGFRATIFHLGVIRYLRDYGLLNKVVAVSSVSGGSLTAAHLVLNWSDYLAGRDECQKALRKLTETALRARLVRRIPWYWLLRRVPKRILKLVSGESPRRTLTTRLAGYYSSYLFPKDSEFAQLRHISQARQNAKAPDLLLMTTNLTQHSSRSFFQGEEYVYFGSTKHLVQLKGYPVGKAVAASSAFPFLFPPLELAHDDPDVGVSQEKLNARAHYLTDGGVFENLGISVLRDLAKERTQQNGGMPPCDAGSSQEDAVGAGKNGSNNVTIIISDAGRRIDWDLDNKSSRNAFLALLRSSEVSQYWAEQRLGVGKQTNELVVPIDEVVGGEVIDTAPSAQTQSALARLRTDFDKFTALEWTGLLSHGYGVAKKRLATIAPQAPIVNDPYRPWQTDVVDDWSSNRTIERLAKGSKRKFYPHSVFLPFDLVGIANMCMTVGVVCVLVWATYHFGPSIVARAKGFLSPNQVSIPVDVKNLGDVLAAAQERNDLGITIGSWVAFTGEVRASDPNGEGHIYIRDPGDANAKRCDVILDRLNPEWDKAANCKTITIVGRVEERVNGASRSWVIADAKVSCAR